jgi:hypothetical protein
MASSLRGQAETIASVEDPFGRRSLRVAYHLRRYAAIYVIGGIGLLALVISSCAYPAHGVILSPTIVTECHRERGDR